MIYLRNKILYCYYFLIFKLYKENNICQELKEVTKVKKKILKEVVVAKKVQKEVMTMLNQIEVKVKIKRKVVDQRNRIKKVIDLKINQIKRVINHQERAQIKTQIKIPMLKMRKILVKKKNKLLKKNQS